MYRDGGFTLIEVAVAAVVGILLVLGIGLLGGNVFHQRISADSNSAAMSLAERHLERLLANSVANPTSTQCATVPANCQPHSCTQALCGSTSFSSGTPGLLHGPTNTSADGSTPVGAPFEIRYWVHDCGSASSICKVPSLKRITVEVDHTNNPQINARLETYYAVN
jgi:type II secretory pathway pseudopilin PulG